MSSDPTPPQPPRPADGGLPPVQPPSGQQILKLFVIPALIVAVLVGLWLLGPMLTGWFNPGKSADQFLRDLDSTNEEVRYRAASDLAQMLPRKEKRAEELSRDVDLCLGLTKRLADALDGSAEAEKSFASRFESMKEEDKLRELKALDRDRNLITYLAASLGHVSIPVGVPLLGRMATQTEGMEPDALSERRRRALFALATLGEKVRHYDELPDDVKADCEDKLEQASKRSGETGKAARVALDGLRARRAGKATTFGVAAILDRTAADSDPYVRQLTAFAANFWKGTAEEEKVIDAFLVALSNDAGVGSDRLAEQQGRNPETKQFRAVTKTKGYNVRVDATLALARRGSPNVPMGMLKEMLDLEKLREVFVIEQQASPEKKKSFLGIWSWTEEAVPAEKPNEPLVVLTATEALKAVAELHAKRPQADLTGLLSLIEALEKSDNAGLASQATKTREALAS
jgi:hypothetical protein